MTSQQMKTVVKYKWGSINVFYVDKFGCGESPNFGVTGSSIQFYLRLNRGGDLSLHLATCPQEKLHIDKFDVWNNFPIFTVHLVDYWEVNCEITYSEPLAKADHRYLLADQLAALRLNSNQSDVTLVTMADGEEFPADKWILSVRSSVFAAMFKYEGMVENVKKRVEIEDVSGEVMVAFLDYIYSGDTRKVEQFAGELFELANKYDVQPLAQASIEAITVDNAAQLYYLTDLHQQEELKKKMMHFISENKVAVMKSTGWKEFIEPHAKLLSQLIAYTWM